MKTTIKTISGILILAFTFLFAEYDLEKNFEEKNYSYTENSCQDSVLEIVKGIGRNDLYIKVGKETEVVSFGMRHIISKHLDDNYFFSNSNEVATKFPKGTTVKDIIEGIKSVYLFGEQVKSKRKSNSAYEKQMEFKGEAATYRLVVRKCDNSVVTFFKREGSEILD